MKATTIGTVALLGLALSPGLEATEELNDLSQIEQMDINAAPKPERPSLPEPRLRDTREPAAAKKISGSVGKGGKNSPAMPSAPGSLRATPPEPLAAKKISGSVGKGGKNKPAVPERPAPIEALREAQPDPAGDRKKGWVDRGKTTLR